jgi:RNA polymerase sigma factor (sigma-70 family)
MDPRTSVFDSDERYNRLRTKLVFFFERRNCPDPEDLADESIRRLLSHVKGNGSPESVEGFSYGIARNVYLEWLRESSKTAPLEPAKPPVRWSSPAQELPRMVAQASVTALDDGERELLEQYYLDGATAETIAHQHGLSPEGIRSRVFRAKRKLLQRVLAEKTGEKMQTN